MNILGLIDLPWWMILILTLLLIYHLGTRNFGVLKTRGIPGPSPLPFLGTILPLFTKGIQKHDSSFRDYGKIAGGYEAGTPTLFIFDVEILKEVLVKQFDCFTNRAVQGIEHLEGAITKFLTSLKDDEWRNVRNHITPSFTSGKMRRMHPAISRCARKLRDNLAEISKKEGKVELKPYHGAYTMDVIALTAFGVELDSQKDPNNAFITHAKSFFEVKLTSNPLILVILVFPFLLPYFKKFGLSKYLQVKSQQEAEVFFKDITERIIKDREKGARSKSDADFVQLCLEAMVEEDKKQNGDTEKSETKLQRKGLTVDEINANAMLFFVAGYETTASSITFLGYNLARNPDVQDKLLEVIDEMYNGKDEVDYETLMKSGYLDQCLEESMRIYPAAPRLDRMCEKDVVINGLHIRKGDKVAVPVHWLHHNEEIYPDPEKFDPDRFSPENKAARDQCNWLPFGMGPRNCIGMRLALLEVKVAIVTILHKHKFVKVADTPETLTFKLAGVLSTNEKMVVGVEPRN